MRRVQLGRLKSAFPFGSPHRGAGFGIEATNVGPGRSERWSENRPETDRDESTNRKTEVHTRFPAAGEGGRQDCLSATLAVRSSFPIGKRCRFGLAVGIATIKRNRLFFATRSVTATNHRDSSRASAKSESRNHSVRR